MAAFDEDVDGFRVGAADEGSIGDVLEAFAQAFVDELAEEVHVAALVVEHGADEVFDEVFRKVHVSLQIAESDFRFDHPEFGRMARGVGVFGAEGGAEGVDVAQGAGHGFAFELAADGEVGGFAEEVFFMAFVVGKRVECGDAEHFARAFAVAGSDERRVYPDEVSFLKEAVDGGSQAAAGAEDGAEEVGAGAQVGDGAQEFGGMPFFLQGVAVRRRADEADGGGLYFPFLFAGAGDEFSLDADGGSGGHFADVFVAGNACVCDDLDGCEAGAVVEFDEGECLGVAPSAYPSFDEDVVHGRFRGERVFDEGASHVRLL